MKMEDVKVSTTFFVIGHMLNVCQVSKTILAILVDNSALFYFVYFFLLLAIVGPSC